MMFAVVFLVFLVSFGLLVSALYFFVQVPTDKRRVRERIAALQQAGLNPQGDHLEQTILRQEVMSELPFMNRLLLHIPGLSKVQLFLEQADVKTPAATLLMMSIAIGLVVFIAGLMLPVPFLFVPLVAGAAAAIPLVVIRVKRQQRFDKFQELFPDSIDLLARAVRAGHAFTTGFALIGSEMPEPVATEFRTTYSQQNLGLSLDDSLKNLALRMPLPDVRIFVSALLIQRESGGNLGEVLDNLSEVIRERFRILRQVQILSAEGRLSMYILLAAPPAAALLLFLINPGYMNRLFHDPWGHVALATAVIMQFIGFLLIRKIVRIEV